MTPNGRDDAGAPGQEPSGADPSVLRTALQRFRGRAADPGLPLDTPDAAAARRTARDLADQLDDYVLPRLDEPAAPLLAVVGGPTGAGKSTLVNSLAGRVVTPAGVLRPTTRSPVLVCAPEDEHWFTGDRVLPGLARTAGPVEDRDPTPGVLHVVTCDTLRPGLALVDAPDIDSVLAENRDLGARLLGAADLWLFVTSAARYADAVPWSFLGAARERGVAAAVVIDRVRPDARQETTAHFARLLAAQGLGSAPFFVLAEDLPESGLLPAAELAGLEGWLQHLADDQGEREAVARRTLDGTLDGLSERLRPVTREVERQDEVASGLRAGVRATYDAARQELDRTVVAGGLVSGDVGVRWQELARDLDETVRRSGDPADVDALRTAIVRNVRAVLVSVAARASDTVTRGSAALRTGPERQAVERQSRALLAVAPLDLGRDGDGLVRRIDDAVGSWLARLRATAGAGAGHAEHRYDPDVVSLILGLVAVAPTRDTEGVHPAIRSTNRTSVELLESVFGGDSAVRHTAAARGDLQGELHAVLESEAARHLAAVSHASLDGVAADRLREVQFGLDAARR